jgi:hypothetical protein
MIDVYYPYFQTEEKWHELKYSIRSIDKFLKEDFRIWIVGDLPSWINPQTINHIPHQRCEGMQENTTFDAVSKLILFINHPGIGDQFIRMYDDIYLLDDCHLSDIDRFRAMYDHTRVPPRMGVWWDQLRRTLQAVIRKGYAGWNTETHLPELFNKEKMRWIIDMYQALEKKMLTSTLYFNTYYSNTKPVMWPDCHGIQFYNNEDNEFYTSSQGNITFKCQGKLFLNHNNTGLNSNLKTFLMNRFPEKSRFEL